MTKKSEPTSVPCPACGGTDWTATISGIQVWTLDTTNGVGLFFYAEPDKPTTIYRAVCDECSRKADDDTLARLTTAIHDPNWGWDQ
jgi:hypothetical protein